MNFVFGGENSVFMASKIHGATSFIIPIQWDSIKSNINYVKVLPALSYIKLPTTSVLWVARACYTYDASLQCKMNSIQYNGSKIWMLFDISLFEEIHNILYDVWYHLWGVIFDFQGFEQCCWFNVEKSVCHLKEKFKIYFHRVNQGFYIFLEKQLETIWCKCHVLYQ